MSRQNGSWDNSEILSRGIGAGGPPVEAGVVEGCPVDLGDPGGDVRLVLEEQLDHTRRFCEGQLLSDQKEVGKPFQRTISRLKSSPELEATIGRIFF